MFLEDRVLVVGRLARWHWPDAPSARPLPDRQRAAV
jgi:hypothetical protein